MSRATCVRQCQSFLWGGSGTPVLSEDGNDCACKCESGWGDHNVVGHASCVPNRVRILFGTLGLLITALHMSHAVYNWKLQRDLYMAASQRAATVRMFVDLYREKLSTIAVMNSVVTATYFGLVLILRGENQRWSAVLLGVSQSLSSVGALVTVQVLIHSIDARLFRNHAFVATLSATLAHPIGRCISYAWISIGGILLALAAPMRRAELGYTIAACMFIVVTTVRIVIISLCGSAMIRIINRSIARLAQKGSMASIPRSNSGSARSGSGGGSYSRGFYIGGSGSGSESRSRVRSRSGRHKDLKLEAARHTIFSALVFCVVLTSAAAAVLAFGVSSGYGAENPLIFMAAPLAIAPMVALSFHIQLHSGRNKRRIVTTTTTAPEPEKVSITPNVRPQKSAKATGAGYTIRIAKKTTVVPAPHHV